MKGKVLLVAPYSAKNVGGIGTWTKNILDYQLTHGNKFQLIFLNTQFKFKPNLVKSNFQRVLYGILDSFQLLFLLIVKIIRYRPQSIHYTSSASFALIKDLIAVSFAKMLGINFILHWHFGRIPVLAEKKNFEWRILVRVAKAANKSIVLDEKSLVSLECTGIKNVKLIPNPISLTLQEIAIKIDLTNKKSEKKTIVYVGHIVSAKGIRELIHACSVMEVEFNLILIGPVNPDFKNEMNLIASSVNNKTQIIWTGEIAREAVFQYLKTANALCLPSYTEGFPNVIIEAMAHGCPIIATRVGAIETIIESTDFGPAGICIDPKNIEQLANAINYILINPDDALAFGKNGVERVLAKYTLDNVFQQYEDLW